jgi:flagellar export protein FliJ
MHKFSFPLSRVLDWRRAQVQLEEATLERLYAELRALETRLLEVRLRREESGRWLFAAGSATGAELASLDSFEKASTVECARLAGFAAATRPRIAAQLQVVIQKRRDVKLLELLHARKLQAWNQELDREIDREAGELYLAKFKRVGQISPHASPVK